MKRLAVRIACVPRLPSHREPPRLHPFLLHQQEEMSFLLEEQGATADWRPSTSDRRASTAPLAALAGQARFRGGRGTAAGPRSRRPAALALDGPLYGQLRADRLVAGTEASAIAA